MGKNIKVGQSEQGKAGSALFIEGKVQYRGNLQSNGHSFSSNKSAVGPMGHFFRILWFWHNRLSEKRHGTLVINRYIVCIYHLRQTLQI